MPAFYKQLPSAHKFPVPLYNIYIAHSDVSHLMVLWSSSVFCLSTLYSHSLSLISRFGSFNLKGQLIISGLAYNYAFAVYFIKTLVDTVSSHSIPF